MPYFRIGIPALLAIALAIPCSLFAQDLPKPETRSFSGQRLNDLAAWDLENDGNFEVYLTTLGGSVASCQAGDLTLLWEISLGTQPITAPVLGDFLGTGAPIMACASADGIVYFLWPGSGEIIGQLATDKTYALAPSVASYPDHDVLVLPDDSGQIVVVELQKDGKPREQVVIPNTVPDNTAFSIIGRMVHPVSCDDINRDGIPEIVSSSSSGVLQVVSLTQPPVRSFTRLAQQTQATTIAGIGPLSAGAPSSIVLGVDATLFIYRWEFQGNSARIEPVLNTPAFGKTHGYILLPSISNPEAADIVSSSENVIAARYLGRGVNGAETLLDIAPQHLTTINPPLTFALPTSLGSGSTSVLAADATGAVQEWNSASTSDQLKTIRTVPPFTGFAAAGPFDAGKLSMVYWNESSGKLISAPLSTEPHKESGPVLTPGVQFSRSGQWGAPWNRRWQEIQSRATRAATSAKSQLESAAADTDSPLDPASILRGISPSDDLAQKYAPSSGIGARLLIPLSLLATTVILIAMAILYKRLRKV